MSFPFSTGRFSELIGLIYDAAINPAGWSIAIEEIRIALDFELAALSLQAMPSGEALLNVTSNIPPDYLDRMASYAAAAFDQWGGLARIYAQPVDQPAVLSRVNPEGLRADTSAANRYFREWARPQGLIDVMSLGLARDERAIGTLAFGRHARAGPIGEREMEGARLILPHLQRAATINRLLDLSALARSNFAAVLDTLAAPIVLTTADLRVAHANPAAHAMLAARDPLFIRDGILGATSIGATSALAMAVSQAARDESAIGRKGLGVPIRWETGSVGALHVLPLRHGRAALDNGAIAAVFVARADTSFVPPTELVSALFGLTPAEARVFEQIVAGRTVAEAAGALQVERSTVKTHLLRLFDKTGVRRQAELIQLAASLAAPTPF